ncbi:MAG: hypothetical protein M1602_00255 [Firmicutes bacterium]|nr:hypothetical protein [Bacillota bacterium]
MVKAREPELNIEPLLQAWPDPTPDPAAMEQVAALMIAGISPQKATEQEPGETHFRILTWIWGAIALAGYLAWSTLTGWFADHPVGTAVIAVIGCASLLAPLVLLLLGRSHCLDTAVPSELTGGFRQC